MKNHGLIRYMDLKELPSDAGEVVMGMDSDEETKKQHPFDFHYEIH